MILSHKKTIYNWTRVITYINLSIFLLARFTRQILETTDILLKILANASPPVNQISRSAPGYLRLGRNCDVILGNSGLNGRWEGGKIIR